MPRGLWQRRLLLVILLAAVVYLAGNNQVGLWDRDEPRYAQTSKQMLLSGDWVVPHLLDKVRTAKPILIYWCQATSMTLLDSTSPFAARLPSVVSMLATVAIVGTVIGRGIGWRRGVWTAFILSTSGLVIAAAKMCITDSLLLLWITIAQLCLFAIYSSQAGRGVILILWIAISLAALTKGPVVLATQLTTMIVLAILDVGREWRQWSRWKSVIHWWRDTRPLLGILIVALIGAPWVIALHYRAPTFLRDAFWHDVWQRSTKALEGHKGPPGYYLLTIWGTYFPWSLLLVTAFVIGWKHRALRPIRFALAAIIGPWLLMEMVQTKLAHYLLPAFPPLAFLTAEALIRCARRQHPDLTQPLAVQVAGLWALAVCAVGIVPWLFLRWFTPVPILSMILVSGLTIAFAVAVLIQFYLRQPLRAAVVLGTGMAALILSLYTTFLPRAWFLWTPQRVAAVLQSEGAVRPGDVIMIDYKEDSLPYYQGGTIRQQDDDFFGRNGIEKWPKWVVITREAWTRMPAVAHDAYQEVSQVRGMAYADGGRIVDVLVLRRLRS